MKVILLGLFVLIFGCGKGGVYSGYDRHCIEGVVYYNFYRGAVVGYNQDGTIKTCEEK